MLHFLESGVGWWKLFFRCINYRRLSYTCNTVYVHPMYTFRAVIINYYIAAKVTLKEYTLAQQAFLHCVITWPGGYAVACPVNLPGQNPTG